jgi:uncharacterized repeat protein (TIGR03803 family)
MRVFRLPHISFLTLFTALFLFPLLPAQPQTVGPDLSPSARFCVLYDFGDNTGDPTLQVEPSAIAQSVDGQDGYLYSTSTSGGKYGYGTVFKISKTNGKRPIVLYDFDLTTGAAPQGGLVRGSDGAFYGTSNSGGKYSAGTFFRITSDGSMKTLWAFRDGVLDPPVVGRPPTEEEKLRAAPGYPISTPVEVNGVWYGVTPYANHLQQGVIYAISGGDLKGLYQYKPADSAANGYYPTQLTLGKDGNLYGTTRLGALGWGTAFMLSGTGGGMTILHKFDAASLGTMGVIQGDDGALYGTSTGPNTTFGLIYRIDPKTKDYKVIHTFDGNNGAGPVAGVILGTDGFLYGVTRGGGKAGRGVIYRLHPDGSDFANLFTFDLNDGRYAISPPIQQPGSDPKAVDLYGFTYMGGKHDVGAFYHLNVHMYPAPSHDSDYTVALKTEAQDVSPDFTVRVQSGVNASQNGELKQPNGITVTNGCMRDPHIVQFVYRMVTDSAGQHPAGFYDTTWGRFPLTTDPNVPKWHTDAIGHPNAYYDQAPKASHRTDGFSYVTILDAPNDTDTTHGWAVKAKDFLICNCKVVRVVNWTRESEWDTVAKVAKAPLYKNVSIELPPATQPTYEVPWADAQMKWINDRLNSDPEYRYDPIP